jgi:serine/threonine protein phosphatase PrpC
LQLNTDDEVQVTADHSIRPIIVPRDITKLPWNSGYAECINAGKSLRNEDQAAVYRSVLRSVIHPDVIGMKVADMMPTIQTTPRHSVSQSPLATDSSTEKIPGSAAVMNGESAAIANGHITDSVPVVNGVEAAEVKSSDPLTELTRSVQQLNASDLLSPSQPFPLSEFNNASTGNPPHPLATTPISIQNVASGMIEESLPWTYFGIFDGHAGSAVAVTASVALHKVINDKLQKIADLLIAFGLEPSVVDSNCDAFHDQNEADLNTTSDSTQINRSRKTADGNVIINHDANLPRNPPLTLLSQPSQDRLVTVDSLIIGALESAFWELDAQIGEDKRIYRMPGGCTVLVSLFILGKLYVANAGDSRCIMCRGSKVTPMSYDFTPESERERVKYLGLLKPELLGHEFTHLEYIKRPTRRDIGRKMLYRDAYMTGWCYKTITTDDMRFPLVYGEGKRVSFILSFLIT